MRHFLPTFLAFILCLSSAQGATYAEALAAHQAGRFEEAAAAYRTLAAEGNADAETALGLMNFLGQGMPRDQEQAFNWYARAAEKGQVNAMNNLALMYENGQGRPVDLDAAVSWYRRAAEGGLARAQYRLALLYAQGKGVTRDEAEAELWLQRAAVRGHPFAQTRLGLNYARGRDGKPADWQQAYLWFLLAAAQNEPDALNNVQIAIGRLDRKIPPQSLAQAKTYQRGYLLKPSIEESRKMLRGAFFGPCNVSAADLEPGAPLPRMGEARRMCECFERRFAEMPDERLSQISDETLEDFAQMMFERRAPVAPRQWSMVGVAQRCAK